MRWQFHKPFKYALLYTMYCCDSINLGYFLAAMLLLPCLVSSREEEGCDMRRAVRCFMPLAQNGGCLVQERMTKAIKQLQMGHNERLDFGPSVPEEEEKNKCEIDPETNNNRGVFHICNGTFKMAAEGRDGRARDRPRDQGGNNDDFRMRNNNPFLQRRKRAVNILRHSRPEHVLRHKRQAPNAGRRGAFSGRRGGFRRREEKPRPVEKELKPVVRKPFEFEFCTTSDFHLARFKTTTLCG